MTWVAALVGQLWANVWVLIPLALVAAAIPRLVPCRPVTRHVLWVVVLGWCLAGVLMPPAPSGDWLASLTSRNEIVTGFESLPQGAPTADTNDYATTAARTAEPATDGARRFVPATSRYFAAETPAGATGLPATRRESQMKDAPPPCPDVHPAMRRMESAYTGVDALQTGAPVIAPATPQPEPRAEYVAADPSRAPENEAWRAWAGVAVALRDMLRGLPPIPARLWLGGIALTLALGVLRTLWFARFLRPAWPTPVWVQREVESIARRLHLRRVPRVDMVATRISPMIWCGAHPRLVIPTALWAQLDRNGRRAILCHELAHLRRRDHWVRWLQWVVGALYWWHPIVWWVRKRIDDEADLCCDAWVTWLLPHGRRAYAEALLKTRQYISTQHAVVPGTGMAVATSGARRLARRLTMVMTQTVRPRTSMTGLVLAAGLLLAAWIVTPALSCPPAANMEETAAPGRADAAEMVAATREDPDQPTPPKPPKAPKSPRVPRAEGAPAPAPDGEPRLRTRVEGGGGVGRAPAPPPSAQIGPELVRVYSLPAGQREALTQLMIREDVPIRVRPVDEGLEVHGSPAQHEIFSAFVRALQQQEQVTRTYKLPAGKLDAFYRLMERQDVPIQVSRTDDGITVHGTPLEHEVVARFVHLIHPQGRPEGVGLGMSGRTPFAPPGAWGVAAEEAAAADAARVRSQALEEYARAANRARAQRHTAMNRSAETLRMQAAEIEAQAHSIESQAREFERQYEELEQAAEDLSERSGTDMRKELRVLEREIEKLNRAAERLFQRAEDLHHRADEQETANEAERESEQSMLESEREAHEAAAEAERAAREVEREARDAERRAREAEREAAGAEAESHAPPCTPPPLACTPARPPLAPGPVRAPHAAPPWVPAPPSLALPAFTPPPAFLAPGMLPVPPSPPELNLHQLLERGVRALGRPAEAPAPAPAPPLSPVPAL